MASAPYTCQYLTIPAPAPLEKVELRWLDATGDVRCAWVLKTRVDNAHEPGMSFHAAEPDPARFLGTGKYWTAFASAWDPSSAVKIRPLETRQDADADVEEEQVYRLAAAANVGPQIRAWFHLRAPDEAGYKGVGCRASDRKLWGVAVAVVEKFDQTLEKNAAAVRAMPSFAALSNRLAGDLNKFEKETKVVNNEPFVARNVFVKFKRPAARDVERLVVGDWGSYHVA